MNEFPVVLVINCGSSSIKFSVLDVATCDVLMAGIADGMNTENAFLSINGDKPINLAHSNYEDALKAIAFELEKRDLTDSVALIGHRIAHGGELFTQSVIITDEIIDNIRRVSPLAPLHNYANLSGIDAARHLFPAVRQVAVFDTSFHQTLAPEAYLYGLPWEYFPAWVCVATAFTVRRIAMFRGARMNYSISMKKLGSDCRASGQWGVYLRGTQWSERGYLNGDDAA